VEKVGGIGGVVFRARDPVAIGEWYRNDLGSALVPPSYNESPWWQEAAPPAFAAFPKTTEYFGAPQKTWMVNFRVGNLDAIVAQLRAAGISVEVDPSEWESRSLTWNRTRRKFS
jgi:glyoxylase I family protein